MRIVLTNPSTCKTNMSTVRRGCITTSLGIISLMRVGL
nr:MAG TPA: E3 ubiquitin-protein ligase [Caudoviricetes sp.]